MIALVWFRAKTRGRFSVNEKDEASPVELSSPGSLDAFILRFAGVEGFLFSSPALVSSRKTTREGSIIFSRATMERSESNE